jgi:tetratricopeptide (TPR) repeat protein
MKNLFIKPVKMLTLTVLASGIILTTPVGTTLIGSTNAIAQQEKPTQVRKKRRVPAMRLNVNKKLENAMAAKDEGDWDAAWEYMDDLKRMRGKNSYEEAMMWYFYGALYYESEQVDKAIDAYKMVLQQDNLPIQFEDSIRYQVGQLLFMTEKYDESLKVVTDWFKFQESPNAQSYLFLGQIYYQLERYRDGIVPIETTINMTKASGGEVRENWYLLLRTMYYELKDYKEVREILEILVTTWPKQNYWLQLASIYSELQEEALQLAVMEVTYQQGFLTKDSHYVNMAQLYLYNEVPWKAAQVMKDGFEQKILDEDQDNFDLYSQALMASKEFAKAVAPLEKAADLSDNGELYIRLAQVFTDLDDFDNVIIATEKGIEKGKLKRPDQAQQMLGMALYNQDKLTQAQSAFRNARKDRRSRKTSDSWLGFLAKEKVRRSKLAEDIRAVSREED